MKVLQVNCVYKKGSTGKIVYDLHEGLKERGVESIVCYGRGEKIDQENVHKTATEFLSKFNNLKSRFTGLQYNGSFFGTQKLLKIIEVENPDIVHLQCINGFFVNIYKLINFLKEKNIKTVLTLHAEFMYTGSCGHAYECEQWKKGCVKCGNLKDATGSYLFDRTREAWRKMKMVFDEFDNLQVVSVSPWLEKRARESSILGDKKHCTILNGIDTKNVFNFKNTEKLRKELKLKNEKIILHVTPNFYSECKGGKYVLDIARKLENENYKIIIVGNTGKKIEGFNNVIDIGRVENQLKLAEYYSLADITLLTSKRETFSMVCAESISCGTPVIGFKAGGPELIALKEMSNWLEYGDIKGIINDIRNIKVKKEEKKSLDNYSREIMIERYVECYENFKNF